MPPPSLLGFVDIVLALRAFYLGSAAFILLVYLVRPLRERFLAYGARAVAGEAGHKTGDEGTKDHVTHRTGHTGLNASLMPFLDYIASFQVPHSWFASFYMVSVVSSSFWLHQIVTVGPAYQAISRWTQPRDTSMSLAQIALCWALMALQGIRRMFECSSTKSSNSTMWLFHWLIGVLFYIATGVAIWVEGIPALESNDWASAGFKDLTPYVRVVLCLSLFAYASFVQHNVHKHLASLKKYSLPSHSAFDTILSPHYTAECVIYATLAVLASPNDTMLCALVFVVVNLGVTADISKKWAADKFGRARVADKWRMIPGVW